MRKFFAVSALLIIAVVQLFATCATTTINNQCIFTDAAPAITACGTSPSAASGSTSNGGTITVGKATLNNYGQANPTLNCTLTFATAFTTAPSVTVTPLIAGTNVLVRKVSTTVVTIGFSNDFSGQKFSFIAF